MNALLRLELRRQRAIVVRLALLTIGVGVVFYFAGKRTSTELLAAMIGSSLGVVLVVPMGIARDKLEGTLEFICSLPVEPRVIAASRFAAMAMLSIPWAAGIGVMSLASPPGSPIHPLTAAILSWLVMVLLGSCALALMTRFEFEQLLGVPMVVLVMLAVLIPRAIHAMFPEASPLAVWRLMSLPGTMLLAVALLASASAAVVATAFQLTKRALSSYRHDATLG